MSFGGDHLKRLSIDLMPVLMPLLTPTIPIWKRIYRSAKIANTHTTMVCSLYSLIITSINNIDILNGDASE